MNSANNVHTNDLGTVVMPLVDLLTSSGLSWSQRQAIACAIRETTRHHNSMESERRKSLMSQAAGQIIGAALQSGVVGRSQTPGG